MGVSQCFPVCIEISRISDEGNLRKRYNLKITSGRYKKPFASASLNQISPKEPFWNLCSILGVFTINFIPSHLHLLSPMPLSDLKILDLSRVLAGPYCTMLLADFGAEVWKIEQPETGDITRSWSPPSASGESAYYLSVNRNKKSFTADLKSESGRNFVKNLALQADVLVENFLPDTLKSFGLDYETLSILNPQLIYCSITGYGQTGPYAHKSGFDFMIQAEGGLMSIGGEPDGNPMKTGVAIADITAGIYASHAILAALHHRNKTGEGQYIDVALFDAQLGWLANVAQSYLVSGKAPQRYGNAHPNIVPYQLFETKDGHLALAIGTEKQFKAFCQATNPAWWNDDFNSNEKRVQNRNLLIPQIQHLLKEKSTSDWVDLFEKIQVPAAPVNSIPQALHHPQALHRGMVQTVQHPTIGDLKVLGTVAKLSKTPAKINTPPPLLGEHNA